jgi:hypothetical protein
MSLDKSDNELWAYCLKGGTWCPHSESRKRKGVTVVSSTDAEKEKPPYEGRQVHLNKE